MGGTRLQITRTKNKWLKITYFKKGIYTLHHLINKLKIFKMEKLNKTAGFDPGKSLVDESPVEVKVFTNRRKAAKPPEKQPQYLATLKRPANMSFSMYRQLRAFRKADFARRATPKYVWISSNKIGDLEAYLAGKIAALPRVDGTYINPDRKRPGFYKKPKASSQTNV